MATKTKRITRRNSSAAKKSSTRRKVGARKAKSSKRSSAAEKDRKMSTRSKSVAARKKTSVRKSSAVTPRTGKVKASKKVSGRSRERMTDFEADQYKRNQTRGSSRENVRARSETERKGRKSSSRISARKDSLRNSQHNFGRGMERELMAENRSARKRRMKDDRQQFNESRTKEHWPLRGTNDYRRQRENESYNRGREEDYPSRQYEKRMYGNQHEEDSFAIRKGSEMYLPGYEDVDVNVPETKRHVDLHRGQDNYPSSFTNTDLYGGLPDEDYYETRYREWYENKGRNPNFQDSFAARTRNYFTDRTQQISEGEQRMHERRSLRKTGRNKRGSRAKSAATRHNQIARGWDL